jgi:RNA polymerase sigma factor (sigma-70 family)
MSDRPVPVDQPSAPADGEPANPAASPLGDGDFAELYLEHYSRLVRALIIAGSDPLTAQDLAQEAFARTFARWRRVRDGPNPAGYVHTTAFRLLHHRRPITETPVALDDTSLPAVPPVDHAALTAAAVRGALAGMAPRQRACVALCLYLGHSTGETAELLGISPSTVRVQLHRARQRLRAAAVDDRDSHPIVGNRRTALSSQPDPRTHTFNLRT